MTHAYNLSPIQCRILSELLPWGSSGLSCTALAKRACIERATLYVLMGRLQAGKCVRKMRARVPGRNEYQVLYAITAAGRDQRKRFARELGLKS